MDSQSENKNDELDNNWNQASFAKLLGFYDENQPELTEEEEENKPESTQNQIATQELFDDHQIGKTQPNFYSNPFAKFGAVGLVMLVVFGAAATVLNTIMSGKPKVAPTTEYSKQSKPKVEIADNPQETETGRLKAELALSTQAEKIKSVERAKSPKTIVNKTQVEPSKELNQPPVTRSASTKFNEPIRRSISSRQIPRNQVPYIPQPVRYSPPIPPVSIPLVRQFQPVANKASKPINFPIEEKADPMEEWLKISRLGSYGSSIIATNTDDEQDNGNMIDTSIPEQQQPAIQKATLVSAVQTSQPAKNDQLEPLYSEEAAIIGYQNDSQLTVGASVSGKLITPLTWSRYQNSESKNNSISEKFIIKLEQPLTTPQGFVVLPIGSRIVVTLNNVNEAGFVELQATQVLIHSQEYNIPSNAIAKRCCKQIAIRGSSGQPLIASRLKSNKGEVARRDAETFAVGSLAKVGKVLNQPKEEQISTSSGFGSTNSFSNVRRGRENILGAVLEGGFEPLTQQILKRNQQALQEIQQQEDVWYVKAGTNVQVFVNQSFQF
ncbi:MAG: TrbI/VirB10 family protein [Richelia sp. RM2_1_2]|nr:TrbI/VirB10 family protein [Richelia sp. SM1_7_0]NJO62922.1 TrbI/VirB10 family protein [Richelia sp. RM2_1_2]